MLVYESLSAGAWYVAIDCQMYALALWMAGRLAGTRPLAWLVPLAFGAALSLLYFNLDAGWDNWRRIFSAAMVWACWPGGPAIRAARMAP